MQPDQTTLLSRSQGTLPDKYWHQLNGKTAQENYLEEKERIMESLDEQPEDAEEIYITS